MAFTAAAVGVDLHVDGHWLGARRGRKEHICDKD
jgi:hypothetical protein